MRTRPQRYGRDDVVTGEKHDAEAEKDRDLQVVGTAEGESESLTAAFPLSLYQFLPYYPAGSSGFTQCSEENPEGGGS
jgi:hypothetical protein